ncbi:MAG: indole-3-glycerol phosphate synthase TrpC [Polyangiaceae bacterium]
MNVLTRIIDRKRSEIAALPARPVSEPRARRSLSRAAARGGVIAEFKRRSPSRGAFAGLASPEEIATAYARAGAIGVSVLTDEASFGGSFEDLARVRRAVDLPLLCKDFVVEEAQLDHAAASGADAVLLIVAAVPLARLRELREAAGRRSLEVLVEVHDEGELAIAERLEPELIGVNNRDLRTLEVDLGTAERVLSKISSGPARVAESGVTNAAGAARMFAAGAHALLVGEALLSAADPAALLASLEGAR